MSSVFELFRRNHLLRFAVCLFFALLCSFSFFAPPVVTAHAFAITSALLTATAALLVSIGIAFPTSQELQKGASTFYNSCKTGATDIKNFLDDASKKITVGTATAIAVPVAVFYNARKAAQATFPPTQTAVPDTSGIVDSRIDVWRTFAGKTISFILSGGSHNGVLDGVAYSSIPVSLNTCFPNSPNSSVHKELISVDLVSKYSRVSYGRDTLYMSNIVSQNESLRFLNASGNKNDLSCKVFRSSGSLYAELSLNGSYYSSTSIPFSGTLQTLQPYFSLSSEKDAYGNVIWKPNFSLSYSYISVDDISSTGLISFPIPANGDTSLRLGAETIFSGIVDSVTGALDSPLVTYSPDLTITNTDLLNKSLEEERKKNPAYAPELSIPADSNSLVGAKWDEVLASNRELVQALRDAIAALGEIPKNPPAEVVDIGNVGLETITALEAVKNNLLPPNAVGWLPPKLKDDLNSVDPSTSIIPTSFSAAILWVNAQFAKCFNQLGDYQFIILYPMFVGIALLLIGRGAQAVASTSIRRALDYVPININPKSPPIPLPYHKPIALPRHKRKRRS